MNELVELLNQKVILTYFSLMLGEDLPPSLFKNLKLEFIMVKTKLVILQSQNNLPRTNRAFYPIYGLF